MRFRADGVHSVAGNRNMCCWHHVRVPSALSCCAVQIEQSVTEIGSVEVRGQRVRMKLKVGLRDGNRELGAFRGATRLVVDGNQGRGDVCAFPFDIRSQ